MPVFGIVADIHGNLAALEAVVRELDTRGVRDVFCLGDLVGYCAEPNQCVDMARARQFQCIAGNHELIATGELGLDRCGLRPAHALKRTRQTLNDGTRRFIATLPLSLVLAREYVFLHGSVNDVRDYMANPNRVRENHRALTQRYPGARVCFFGHTHVPKVFAIEGGEVTEREPRGTVVLGHQAHWFCNPGSVDGSRAPEAVARYATFDDSAQALSFYAARYDHQGTEKKARREGYRMPRSTLAWHAGASFARSLAARVGR